MVEVEDITMIVLSDPAVREEMKKIGIRIPRWSSVSLGFTVRICARYLQVFTTNVHKEVTASAALRDDTNASCLHSTLKTPQIWMAITMSCLFH